MDSYCTILLNPATKADILAACIQAAAALAAGEAQAGAAWFSAYATLLAGAAALLAGFLAYRAAMQATKDAASQRRAREMAYAGQVRAILSRVIPEIKDLQQAFNDIGKFYTDVLKDVDVTSLSTIRDELHPLNWDRHALLGLKLLPFVTEAYETTQKLIVAITHVRNVHLPHLDIMKSQRAAEAASQACQRLVKELSPPAHRNSYRST